jgi:hypothetical protein
MLIDDVLKILDTPESEGGLTDAEKILAASNLLHASKEPAPDVDGLAKQFLIFPLTEPLGGN